MTAGSLVTELHSWLAIGAAGLAVLVLVLGGLMAVGAGALRGRLWVDRALLALLAALAAAAVVGPLAFILAGPPRELLHLVYAAVAIAAAPLARVEAMRRRSARVGGWVMAGGLVTLAALFRLWGTGG